MDKKKIMSLDDFPEWQKAREKSAQLTEDLGLVRKKIHNKQAAEYHAYSNDDRLYSEALRLVEGGTETPPQQEELATLRDQELVLRTAQIMQAKKLSKIKDRISGEICRDIKPQYDEIVKRLIKTAVTLQGVAREERKFRDMLHGVGVECSCLIPEIFLGLKFDEKISAITTKAKNNNYIK